MRRALPALLALALASCGTARVELPYRPTGIVVIEPTPSPSVAIVAFHDDRPGADPYILGDIRTFLGIRQGALETAAPIPDVIAAAINDGLAARGMLALPGTRPRYDLTITLLDLRAGRDHRVETIADFTLTLTDHGGDEPVYADHVRRYDADIGYVTPDTGPVILAGPGPIRRQARFTISAAVDDALDKPGFRRALRAVRPEGVTPAAGVGGSSVRP